MTALSEHDTLGFTAHRCRAVVYEGDTSIGSSGGHVWVKMLMPTRGDD
jgi:hypothetical protein